MCVLGFIILLLMLKRNVKKLVKNGIIIVILIPKVIVIEINKTFNKISI